MSCHDRSKNEGNITIFCVQIHITMYHIGCGSSVTYHKLRMQVLPYMSLKCDHQGCSIQFTYLLIYIASESITLLTEFKSVAQNYPKRDEISQNSHWLLKRYKARILAYLKQWGLLNFFCFFFQNVNYHLECVRYQAIQPPSCVRSSVQEILPHTTCKY